MSEGKLEGRRKTFAEKVAEGHTATEAYLLAGYRPAKRETAHRAASRLYANPGVRAYIRELRRTGDELAREETTLTIARKLTFLARLVLTSSATLREDDPLIQSHRILKDGTASIRIPCKLKALKMHSELAGHFLPAPTLPSEPTDPLQELFDQIRKGTGLEAQRAETRTQAIPQSGRAATPQSGPTMVPTETLPRHIASPSECDGIASGPHWPLTTGLEAHKAETRTPAIPQSGRAVASQSGPTMVPTETLPRHIASLPECDGIASGPHWPLTTGLEAQGAETRTQAIPQSGRATASQCGPTMVPTETLPRHIASPPECDGIASGPHWPLTTGLEAPRAETRTPAIPQSGRAVASQCGPTGPHWPLTPTRTSTLEANATPPPEVLFQTQQTTTNRNPLTEQDPEPSESTPSPICKLTTEPLKTLPLSPAQVRKAIVSQLQQSSPIRHLYQAETSVENY